MPSASLPLLASPFRHVAFIPLLVRSFQELFGESGLQLLASADAGGWSTAIQKAGRLDPQLLLSTNTVCYSICILYTWYIISYILYQHILLTYAVILARTAYEKCQRRSEQRSRLTYLAHRKHTSYTQLRVRSRNPADRKKKQLSHS